MGDRDPVYGDVLCNALKKLAHLRQSFKEMPKAFLLEAPLGILLEMPLAFLSDIDLI